MVYRSPVRAASGQTGSCGRPPKPPDRAAQASGVSAKKTHLDCRVALRSDSLALLGASLVCMVPRRALASHPTLGLLGTAGKSGRCGRFLVRFSNKLRWTRRCLCCLSKCRPFVLSITELCINSQQNYSLRLLVQLASPENHQKRKTSAR